MRLCNKAIGLFCEHSNKSVSVAETICQLFTSFPIYLLTHSAHAHADLIN